MLINMFVYGLRTSYASDFWSWLQKFWHTHVISCGREGVENISKIVQLLHCEYYRVVS
jgi:hypothetical protein